MSPTGPIQTANKYNLITILDICYKINIVQPLIGTGDEMIFCSWPGLEKFFCL
jgi:hypothetical protein